MTSTSEKPELLPCPFCGDSDVRYARSEDECSYVFCHECHCESPRFEQENGKMLAKRAWNTRPHKQQELTEGQEDSLIGVMYMAIGKLNPSITWEQVEAAYRALKAARKGE